MEKPRIDRPRQVSRLDLFYVCQWGVANQSFLNFGGARKTAEARASAGHAAPFGSAIRERESAITLNSEGRWPTSNDHLLLACLQDSSHATCRSAPLPRSPRAFWRAAVLSPNTATDVSTKSSAHVQRESKRAQNSQNVWKAVSHMRTRM